MSVQLIFDHGWSFDDQVWWSLPLAIRSGSILLDRGYFGQPASLDLHSFNHDVKIIVVTHSMGCLRWLDSLHRISQVIVINGFPALVAQNGYPGVRSRVIQRMQRQFLKDPVAVVRDFRKKMGGSMPKAKLSEWNLDTLSADLKQLALDSKWSLWSEHASKIYFLASTRDVILPESLSRQAAEILDASHVEWIDSSSHLLPVSHAEYCQQYIQEVIHAC